MALLLSHTLATVSIELAPHVHLLDDRIVWNTIVENTFVHFPCFIIIKFQENGLQFSWAFLEVVKDK